jgi:hypothetical protein
MEETSQSHKDIQLACWIEKERAMMSGQPSQAHSTHQAPLEARLKKLLRLNRGLFLFFAHGTGYQELIQEAVLVTAVMEACCGRGAVFHSCSLIPGSMDLCSCKRESQSMISEMRYSFPCARRLEMDEATNRCEYPRCGGARLGL